MRPSAAGLFMNRRSEKGLLGENLACSYLEQQGYMILCRNFRCRMGELDIVAEKGGVLTFAEVKTRSSGMYGEPREAVTISKQKKIYRCAEYYMLVHGIIQRMPVLSFDVIEIITEGSAVKSLKHFPHCF